MYSSPFQEFFLGGISRILDRTVVRLRHCRNGVFECRDYEHKRPEGLRGRLGGQLH